MQDGEQIVQRRAKLAVLRERGEAYPNDFRRSHLAEEIRAQYGALEGSALEAQPVRVRVAGRMMTRRVMGKASFVHIQDMTGRIQLYVQRDALAEGDYQEFKRWDLGDILGAEGTLFRTRTGELSVRVSDVRLLAKALRPLPEKFHGLVDQELRYRQRYLDLIMNDATRDTFRMRTRVVHYIRQYLTQRGYLEVETPMMQIIPGGATARPFATHHNALDIPLYLRIAPELYLKRLVVGGLEKVFEINRNFRNEGISARHNPEFTMLELYEAYVDFRVLMDLTEDLLRSMARDLLGSTTLHYQGEEYDLGPAFPRMSVREAILAHNPDIAPEDLDDLGRAEAVAERLSIPLKKGVGLGKVQVEIFEKTVEPKLRRPTFITGYPTEVSPLARHSRENPFLTDRFELFIGGWEIANGFSELNDPEEQAERFRAQLAAREAGDDEAMLWDADFLHALEHGMPPTAGEGIGIDRLVMVFADASSIRDVLLFPLMRPGHGDTAGEP